ncbi:MAG TPA: amino acid permease [Bacteroidia bacterium]|jgi:APA family basic amino acid/polyamine antiporter|nr:amino acid permease [Bacteroidia bacterium]
MSKQKIGLFSATAIVVANMIGTAVWVSIGYQLMGLHSGFALILLWIIGGITALLGALCYGEIGAAFTRSGGEYNYLSELYHPAVGFLSGFISSTVAFAAPVAAAALALGGYAGKVFTAWDPRILATVVVVALTAVHSLSLKSGSRLQNIFTSAKVLLILFIIAAGFLAHRGGDTGFVPGKFSLMEILSGAFAINLYFVSYAYSGWNAAAYLSNEIEEPRKNLPKALLFGTLIVSFLYILLNFVFLYVSPQADLSVKGDYKVVEVGFVAANQIFGIAGGKIIALIIAVLLISTVSSMIIAGPRVTMVMGEDIRLFSVFAKKNRNGIPSRAVLFQSAISLYFIYASTFDEVIKYIGFTLSLFTFLTVLGIFILRARQKTKPPEYSYRTWGYPVTPILFLILISWMLIYGFIYQPRPSLEGLATVACGLIIYFINKKITPKPTHESLQK